MAHTLLITLSTLSSIYLFRRALQMPLHYYIAFLTAVLLTLYWIDIRSGVTAFLFKTSVLLIMMLELLSVFVVLCWKARQVKIFQSTPEQKDYFWNIPTFCYFPHFMLTESRREVADKVWEKYESLHLFEWDEM